VGALDLPGTKKRKRVWDEEEEESLQGYSVTFGPFFGPFFLAFFFFFKHSSLLFWLGYYS
jgi:hypothetical protein